MSFKNLKLAGLLILSVLVAASAFAQTQTSGSLQGYVKDANGPLPGVTVTLTSPALQGSKIAVTDSNGFYRFSLLPPGTYSVQASLSGFQPLTRSNVEVALGKTVTLEMTMSTEFAQEITVTGTPPVLDITSTKTGANVSSQAMQSIPVARDFTAVAKVAPGTNEDAAGVTVFGSTGAENQYIIDGLNTTGVELGTDSKQLNVEFIQEVEVLTGGLPAEYGRLTGGVINAITKSGGNEFHGDAFGYFAGGGLRSDNTTAAERPVTTTTVFNVDNQQDYGLDLGGYFLKDRLWFFGAYDRVNETDQRTIIRPIDAVGAPGVGSVIDEDITKNLWAGKLTLRINDNNNIYGSVFADPSTSKGPQFGIAGPKVTWYGERKTGGTDAIVRYNGIFGQSFLVNAAAGQHREKDNTSGPGANQPEYIDYTLGDTPVVTNGFGFYQDQKFKRDQYKFDVSKFLGPHELKAGIDYEDISAENNNFNGGAGQRIYIFCSDGDPGSPECANSQYYRHRFYVNDLAPGYVRSDPSTWQIAVPLTSKPETKNNAVFLQDSWKVAPNFTFNAGIRWEKQDVIGRDGSTAIEIKNNWSPRIGAIWDVMNNGKSKLYANYGRFYEAVPMDINIRAFGGEVQCFCYNFDPNPSNILPDANAPRRSGLLGGTEPVDPNLKGQYIDEYLLGYEYEVANNLALGIKGTYRNLGRVIEDFLIISEGNYFIANPGEGIGKEVTFYDYSTAPAPKAERKYKGIELTARKRFSNNYQFWASYTWSKLEGNYDGLFQSSTGQLDPNINSAFDYADFMINAKGKLTGDRKQQFKLNGSYAVSDGPLNGLTFGLSTWYYSGTPLTAYGYSYAYANWEYFLTPRGSLGRAPADYEADIHVGYPWKLGNGMELNFLVDVFNILDRQAKTDLDQRYNLASSATGDAGCAGIPDALCNGDGGLMHQDGVVAPLGQLSNPRATAPNPDFLKAGTAFTDPRSIRVGVRFKF
ncbi:MAG: TonB-dependent receptor [Thermoanaerobaculia bacterium]